VISADAGLLDTQKCCRNYCNTVGSAVRLATRCHDDRVAKIGPHVASKPMQMGHVGVIDGVRELHLDRLDPLVRSHNDKVDFVISAPSAQVVYTLAWE
jgi:hypothetical protein